MGAPISFRMEIIFLTFARQYSWRYEMSRSLRTLRNSDFDTVGQWPSYLENKVLKDIRNFKSNIEIQKIKARQASLSGRVRFIAMKR